MNYQYLRELAKQVLELSNTDKMSTLKKEWTLHNKLQGERPMICVSPEGAWSEIFQEKDLVCQEPFLRNLELILKMKLFWGNEIQDDTPISNNFNIPYSVDCGEFSENLRVVRHVSDDTRGSFHYERLIEDIEKDFHKLSFRKVTHDKELSEKNYNIAGEIFGDILNVRRRGTYWWTCGLTSEIIKFVGLQEFMLLMYDDPDGVHKLMKWFSEENLNFLDQFEQLDLLSLNNEDEIIASGGIGYSDELPSQGSGYFKTGKVTFADMWGFSESQETVGISPDMFYEFVFPYQKPILKKFGLNCYGCCEPVEKRWEAIKTIPNLRRISVSPWSDQDEMKDILGKNYIFSRKPNPSFVTNGFNMDSIETDLEKTMSLSKDINLEIILKDTHTIEHTPQRFKQWVDIARKISANKC